MLAMSRFVLGSGISCECSACAVAEDMVRVLRPERISLPAWGGLWGRKQEPLGYPYETGNQKLGQTLDSSSWPAGALWSDLMVAA